MTNSQVKKAIDETIGIEPLMNEAFVQKVLTGKQKSKKLNVFLQPAFVVVLMLMIGAILYFTPQEQRQATAINELYLSDEYAQLVGQYYAAFANKDEKTVAKIAETNYEEALFRYNQFDLTGPLTVLRTIDEPNEVTLLMKLSHPDGTMLVDTITINKETKKIEADALQTMRYFVEDVTLPEELAFNYVAAPTAPIAEQVKFNKKNAYPQTIHGYTLYQIEQDDQYLRIFETPSGELLDLGLGSSELAYFQDGGEGRYYIVDPLTKELVFVYHNANNTYQMISGLLDDAGLTTYRTEFHEEPVFLFGGTDPKIVLVEEGELRYANVFEQEKFYNSPLLYRTETIGTILLVVYQEDERQISSYYELTSKNTFTNSNKVDLLLAKPEHFDDLWLQNRYKDQDIYVFKDGMLHVRERENAAMDVVERTYTNIQVETEGDQYFITGDNGFSWTLTRTAPRILQDEHGIEYTAPIAFEDMNTTPTLLEGNIQAITLQKYQGFDIKMYKQEGGLDDVNALFNKASANTGITDMATAEWLVEVQYENGQNGQFFLWLEEEGQTSAMMKKDNYNNAYTLFTIPDALAEYFRQLIKGQ